jgi:hypothetical protein
VLIDDSREGAPRPAEEDFAGEQTGGDGGGGVNSAFVEDVPCEIACFGAAADGAVVDGINGVMKFCWWDRWVLTCAELGCCVAEYVVHVP